ncbi:MAG: MarR family transcriptional regulator [Thermoleophilia bacterium]|nr:MarR family transcriptional regulator [Thermoleophilia bacterium]
MREASLPNWRDRVSQWEQERLVEKQDRRRERAGQPKESTAAGIERRIALMRIVGKMGEAQARELASTLRLTRSRVLQILAELEESGLIERTEKLGSSHQKYVPTGEALAVLSDLDRLRLILKTPLAQSTV